MENIQTWDTKEGERDKSHKIHPPGPSKPSTRATIHKKY